MTDLEIILPTYGLVEFNPLRDELLKLRAESRATVFDYTTEKGQKEARSYVMQFLRKSKKPIADQIEAVIRPAKKLYDDGMKLKKACDEFLDEDIKFHMQHVEHYEGLAKARIDAIKARLQPLESMCLNAEAFSEQITIDIDLLEAMTFTDDDGWDEFVNEARELRFKAVTFQKEKLALALQHEENLKRIAEMDKQKAELDRKAAELAAREAALNAPKPTAAPANVANEVIASVAREALTHTLPSGATVSILGTAPAAPEAFDTAVADLGRYCDNAYDVLCAIRDGKVRHVEFVA